MLVPRSRILFRCMAILLLGLSSLYFVHRLRVHDSWTVRTDADTIQDGDVQFARVTEQTTMELGTTRAEGDTNQSVFPTIKGKSQTDRTGTSHSVDQTTSIHETQQLKLRNRTYSTVIRSDQNILQKDIDRNIDVVENVSKSTTQPVGIEVPPFAAKLAETKNLSLTTYDIFGRPRFLIDNDICDENTKILVYVHSAPSYFQKREAMRQTWCNTTLFKDAGLKVAFFVGRSEAVTTDKAIQVESERHRDIIQVDYIDAYRNLTFKVASALTWINTRCNNTKWIVKTDDDMVVDMYGFINQFLPIHDNAKKTMAGMCKGAGNPTLVILRDGGKWGISSDYFPGQKCYKPHCIGAVIFFTGDLVAELYQAIEDVQYFWIDDIFLSRILMERVIDNNVIHLPYRSIDPIGSYCLDHLKTKVTSSFFVCRSPSIGHYVTLWQKDYERFVLNTSYPYSLKGTINSFIMSDIEPRC